MKHCPLCRASSVMDPNRPDYFIKHWCGPSMRSKQTFTFAYRVIRQDKETCQLILAALEERMLSLSEAFNNVVTPDPDGEQFEASLESLDQICALYKIYRHFGGQRPEEELAPSPKIL
jgi:hypothetical protein